MPELPEVEVIKQSLDKKIKFQKINKVVVRNRNLRFKISKDFEFFLKNKKINKISRKSKYLIFHLNNNTFFMIHLGMSGTIHLISKKNYYRNTNTSFYGSSNFPAKHNHILIFFKKYQFVYNDPRRFGFIKIFKNKKNLEIFFNNIGPELLNNKFKMSYLYNYLKGKKKNIKSFLLDQKFVSGIGNIYANEILFYCKINPFKQAKYLTKPEIRKIKYFSKLVLNRAIKKGGSSIRDFKNIKGKKGNYQNEFKVYQRESLNCLAKYCYGKIKKKIVSKRSTFFCNSCQK
jgi:formamidopyrimidine-DNA glycosylase